MAQALSSLAALRPLLAATVLVFAALTSSADAHASGRQLHGGPLLGGSWSSNDDGGGGGSVGALGAYDITDVVRVYAAGAYHLGADRGGQLVHRGDFAVGVGFALDFVSVVPWVGFGPQLSVLASSRWVGPVPGVELRGGLDWLATRYLGLQVTLAGTPSYFNISHSGVLLSAALGLRLTADL